MQIIPTILEKEFFKAEERLNSVKDLTSWVQIDVVDGIFSSGKLWCTLTGEQQVEHFLSKHGPNLFSI